MFTDPKFTMKPMMIVPPDLLDEANLQLLRDNGICAVVAKDPSKLRFVDPIPAVSSRTQIERAAINFSRKILREGTFNDANAGVFRGTLSKMFVDLLVAGTPLDPEETVEEKEEKYFSQEKALELQQIAREEAREERAAQKAAKKK